MNTIDTIHGAVGHIAEALAEAEQLARVYGLQNSIAMSIIRHRLKIAMEAVGAVADDTGRTQIHEQNLVSSGDVLKSPTDPKLSDRSAEGYLINQ